MKRRLLVAMLLPASMFGGTANATCTETGTSVGVSQLYTTQVAYLKAEVRLIGAPLPLAGPAVTAASVCSDGTVGPVAAIQITVTDVTWNWVFCNEWLPLEPGMFEPTLNGGIFRMREQEGVPCGINGTFNTDPGQRGPTELPAFPATERSDSTGMRFSASFSGADHAVGHVWGPSGSEYHNANYGRHWGFTSVAYMVGVADHTN